MTTANARSDNAALAIVASNLLTLLTAWWQDWPLALLLWPYWCQSLIIGWFARKRILALQNFSTEGFRINDQAVAPTPETRRRTASFFALHYGFFHLGYLAFLVASASGATVASGDGTQVAHSSFARLHGSDVLLILALSISFWFSHRASHREHVAADLQRTPNIGTLMFMPYLRVVPMHLTIILGLTLGDDWGRLMFGSLKTASDVLMHKIEHRWLQGAVTRPAPHVAD
jgi:uncharacterized protein DUF6498